MTVTLTNDSLSAIVDKSEMEANFEDLRAAYEALTSEDFRAKASIRTRQFAARYQHSRIDLCVYAEALAAGWPASGVMAAVIFKPRVETDDLEDLFLYDAHWCCTDFGAGAGTFSLQWGSFETGSWVGTQIASDTIATPGAGLYNEEHFIQNDGSTYPLPPSGFTQADNMGLAIIATGADAAALSNQGSLFRCTCIVRRELTGQ